MKQIAVAILLMGLRGPLESAPQPLTRHLYWQPASYGQNWTFRLEIEADSNGATWTARGWWGKQAGAKQGKWSVAQWNALASNLLPAVHNLPPRQSNEGEVNVLQINAEPKVVFNPGDSDFEKRLNSSALGAIERKLESETQSREYSHRVLRTYHLKRGNVYSFCGYHGPKYPTVEFIVHSSTQILAFARPENLAVLEANAPELVPIGDARIHRADEAVTPLRND